ncbi:MAG: major capsid protein [Candidatus Kapabacteria bacterium]|nr:major capsid protein [Candidatus Kapabacteria bacterium]
MPTVTTMTRAVNAMTPPARVLQNLFFPPQTYKFIPTKTVQFDVKRGGRRIAPFCSYYDQSKRVSRKGFQTNTYELPHINLVEFIATIDLQLDRVLGQNPILPEGMSLSGFRNEKIAEMQFDLRSMIENRIELMIAQLLYGSMDVSGDNVNYKIDLGMPTANKPVKTGTARWGQSAAQIAKDIRAWKRVISSATGYSANVMLLGSEAADAFLDDASVMKQLNNNNYRAGALTIEGLDYLGRYAGLDVYERSEQYIVPGTSDAAAFIDPKSAILHATASEKRMHWGSVFDNDAVSLMPFFSKEKPSDDPSGVNVWVKSSPLPVFVDVEATVSATVC